MAEPVRYVVLRHEQIPDPHFDLMFEQDDASGAGLLTWRSPVWPISGAVRLERLNDHRVEYLTSDGPVSGNRGVVRRVAAGTCTLRVDRERQETTVRFIDGPSHPPIVIDCDNRCTPS